MKRRIALQTVVPLNDQEKKSLRLFFMLKHEILRSYHERFRSSIAFSFSTVVSIQNQEDKHRYEKMTEMDRNWFDSDQIINILNTNCMQNSMVSPNILLTMSFYYTLRVLVGYGG